MMIGNYVMLGPGVTIITGDHATTIRGKFMMEVTEKEKPEECDQDVIIEDDVWIGSNVTILKGVRICTGSVIAAGSVVIKDCEPFCIYGGVPAKKLKSRFEDEDLKIHVYEIEGKTRAKKLV